MNEEKVTTNNEDELVDEETKVSKFTFAKTWLGICIGLAVILIVLGIVLYFVKTGDLWSPGVDPNEIEMLNNLR